MDDNSLVRRAIAVARRARAGGNHPFGALLAGPDGTVLMEAGNLSGGAPSRTAPDCTAPDCPAPGRTAPGHAVSDRTAHAERLLMTRASLAYPASFLAGCTMYASAEPCAMCAGAAYWAGLGRVVYALSERELRRLIGQHPQNLTLDLPCRTVFAAGQRRVEVAGPMLEDEARAVHDGFWTLDAGGAAP